MEVEVEVKVRCHVPHSSVARRSSHHQNDPLRPKSTENVVQSSKLPQTLPELPTLTFFLLCLIFLYVSSCTGWGRVKKLGKGTERESSDGRGVV